MIRESLEYLLTPSNPLARKYGFFYQSIALKHRFNRCKIDWLPHLKNCQDLFTETASKLPQKKSVVILGSSHLHEIPIHLLTEHFEQITLVDIFHPLNHHRLAKRNSRLKLVTQDLSLTLSALDSFKTWEDLVRHTEELAERKLFHFEADLIVSANILSQLGLLPMGSIERKIKKSLDVSQKDFICRSFAEAHLKSLKACDGTKLLYADREVRYHDPQGELIYTGHYDVDFTGYKKLKEWEWLLAPLKEASKEYSIQMKIEAFQS